MPDTGSEAEAAVVAWLKQPGDLVEAEEPICLVAWEELTAEVTSPAAGVLRMLALAAGHHAPTGASLAVIDTSVRAAQPEPESVEGFRNPPYELLRGAPIAGPDPVDLGALHAPTAAPLAVIDTDSRAVESEPESALEPDPDPELEPDPDPEAEVEPEPEPEPVESSRRMPPELLRDAPAAEPEPVDLGEFLSPAVRRFSRERGVDPSSVTGTGRDGRVTLRDIDS